ncbi:MAG: ABC transporter permease [Rhodospirillales bacterium]
MSAGSLLRNARYAIRTFSKSPGLTCVAVLALALGIGANTAIFSVVNAVFIRPLPYADAGRLVEISEEHRSGGRMSVSYPNYLDWRKQADLFQTFAAHAVYDGTLMASGTTERIRVGYTGADFLRALRVAPLLGRDFREEDDRQGAAPVAILTHRLWQTRFGSDPAVLGRTVTIDLRSYTVIGVLPPEFTFYRPLDVLIPISDAIVRAVLYLRENHNSVWVIARLKEGATLEQAQSQMSTIAARLEKTYPASNTNVGARVQSLRERLSGDSRRTIAMLLGSVCLVLLIACVNVANLLLARAADRKKEMALRAALGASRRDIMVQLLTESVLLAAAGGALGILLAWWSFSGLIRLVPASIAAGGLSIDLTVLGFTLLVSLLTGVLFGLVPAMDGWRVNPSEALRDGTRTTGAASRGRLRDALVVSEIALALVLLAGAGLLLRTLNHLINVRLGFQTEDILTARVSLPDTDAITPVQASLFYDRLIQRVQEMPGVKAAGLISHIPLGGSFASAVFYRADQPIPPRGQLPAADQRWASPEYFSAMGIPLLRGRLFTPADGRIGNFTRDKLLDWFKSHSFSVVINETMARRFWPNEDPIGKSFRFGFPEMQGPLLTIIGVVGDTRDRGPEAEAPPTWYFSGYQAPRQNETLVVRTAGQPEALISAVRRATAEFEPAAVVSEVRTVEQLVEGAVASRRLNMLLLGIFAGLALLLASVGTYGVMAYAVNRRSHEIGIRLAMGAAPSDIMRLVLGRAALLGALGIAIGTAAALALTRLISGMLYGVKASDPLTFVSVAVVLFGAALAASYTPARRATRISPLATLRSE